MKYVYLLRSLTQPNHRRSFAGRFGPLRFSLGPLSLLQPNHAILVRLFRTSENQGLTPHARSPCSRFARSGETNSARIRWFGKPKFGRRGALAVGLRLPLSIERTLRGRPIFVSS